MGIIHDETACCFTLDVDGYEGRLDYRLANDVMTITHTGVPDAIGGRGVAAQLMQAALAAAAHAGWAVNPACSYAAAYMRRHPDHGERQHADALRDEALRESFPASDPPAVGGST